MDPLMSYIFNVTTLCGKDNFVFWDDNINDFGICFQSLVLISIPHALLAISCAYYLGNAAGRFYLRSSLQKGAIRIRALASISLAALQILKTVLLYDLKTDVLKDKGISVIVECVVQVLSWLMLFAYLFILVERQCPSPRGRRPVLVTKLFVFVVDVIQQRSVLLLYAPDSLEHKIMFSCAIVHLLLLVIILFTLIPSSNNSQSHYVELLTNESEEERTSLLGSRRPNRVSYSGFREPMDPDYLGVAKSNITWMSKLFLHWVNPLIMKGRRGKLNDTDEVFDLPPNASASEVGEKFWNIFSNTRRVAGDKSFFKALKLTFLAEFLLIGILKFIASCSEFASPLILNRIVTFMEDKTVDGRYGYLYALGLLVTATTVALCNVHFNLLMNELKLKVKAAVTTCVYKHTLTVARVDLGTYSTGEIVNAISTDVDRIVNFFPSLHALWSLPLEFIITIVLLYNQVGVSCMAGIAITCVLVPINKVVADKISKLSSEMMLAKDKRVKVMSELLSGIRVLKFFSWEDYFYKRADAHRSQELKFLRGRKYLDAVCVYLWSTTPVLISVTTFTLYVGLGNELSAAKVFTAVALFTMLTSPLNSFPWVILGVIDASVSIKRVSKYLSLPSFVREAYFMSSEEEESVEIKMMSTRFSHKRKSTSGSFSLADISLSVNQGDLIGVVGKVGSGKSSLLDALLGELDRVSGQIFVRDPYAGIGLVMQEHWLQKGTVRDNILFGKVYQPDWYCKVIDACALLPDLEDLHAGDQTDVGEGGAKLSGGQKARVALARAVYQNKEIYLIDDIFSAVDIPVGVHIYKKCILGLLREKTRILCTHHSRFLSAAKQVILIDDGRIVDTGSPKQILSKLNSKILAEDSDESVTSKKSRETKADSEFPQASAPPTEEKDEVEVQERGVVKFEVYKLYWKAMGVVLSPLILVSLTLMQGSKNFTDIWLARWVSSNATSLNATDNGEEGVVFYLSIYGSVALSNTLFTLLRAFLFAYGGVCAAKVVHQRLLSTILRGKVSFFDFTPLGRILNRFSADLYTVDDGLPFILNIFLAQLFAVLGHILVCAYAVPWIALVLVPLGFMLYDLQIRYRPASRDLKRVGSTSLSPIFSHFSETLGGLTTIRAMKAVGRFENECLDKIDANMKAQFSSVAASQWLELRLQLVGIAVLVGVSVIAVIQHGSKGINPGMVGLAISYALGITSKLSGLVSAFAETERELVAVERCCQYIREVPQEDFNSGTKTTPYGWPSEGKVELKNVHFKYRDHLPLALCDLSFDSRTREKVGIVGRTGSGKSSLFHVLFRTFEIESGRVSIDGVDTRQLRLTDLRKQLTIIPQQPFLFSGTVRENLDPLMVRSDIQLWEALKKSFLLSFVERLGGLDAMVSEGGKSFSLGQRQLLCLARAILSSAKIICVDEATANVDFETDRMIQEVLRTAFYDCTVLTIAHRVDTVLGSDRVVVMANGRILEIGHPNILLHDENSAFSNHVANN